jgi:hypothetical protein
MFSGLVIINIIGLLTLIGLLLLLRIKNSEFKRKIEENISRMAELKYQIENYKMSDELIKKEELQFMTYTELRRSLLRE